MNDALASVAVKFGNAIVSLLLGVILARSMTLESYGFYVLSISTVIMLSIPVTLGLPNLIVRYVAKYEVSGDKSKLKGLLIRSNQMVIITTSFVVVLFLLINKWNLFSFEKVYFESVSIGMVILIFLGLGNIRSAVLRGMNFIILGQLPDNFVRNIALLIGVLFCNYSDQRLNPQSVMFIHAVSTLFSFMLGFIILKTKIGKQLGNVEPTFETKIWFNELIPFSFNSGIQIVRSRILTFSLAYFGKIEAVALYEVATKGASLAAFALDAINSAIAPRVSAYYQAKNTKMLQSSVTRTSRIIFTSSFFFVLVFLVGGTGLIKVIFGAPFIASYAALITLCLGQLLSSAVGSVGLVLSMIGQQVIYTKVNFVITILTGILGIIFVKLFGILGAAIISSFLMIVQNIYLLRYLYHHERINTSIFHGWSKSYA